jgi:rhodanese-related sulfurtransferase
MPDIRSVNAKTLKEWLDKGEAVLIDVREPEENEKDAIPGTILIPLQQLTVEKLVPYAGKKIVFHCRSGKRSANACLKIVEKSPNLEVYTLEGGINSWKENGLASTCSSSVKISIDRQVHIAVGGLILFFILLGYLAHPAFFMFSGLISIGLILSGISGKCWLALALMKMPWNCK